MRRPILNGNYPTLRIYPPTAGAEKNVNLNFIEDLYKKYFHPAVHHNFIGTEQAVTAAGSVAGDHFIVSVLDEPTKGKLYSGLQITKKGYKELSLTIPEIPNTSIVDRILKALPSYVDGDNIYPVFNPLFPSDILKIEEKHPQKKSAMKIGLVYCRKGQSHPQEMFRNGLDGDECSVKFWKFVNLMGHEINLDGWKKYTGDMKGGGKSYYDEWNNIEIIYHVAPMLGTEGHRRLIGNDIAVMFFLEEGSETYFNPSSVGMLGTVPQVFAVIQPDGEKYRIGFFSNINIKEYPPGLPLEETLDPAFTKEIVLTKLYNGLVQVNYCPPMNRLYYVPRKETIEQIVVNYPIETRREKRAREKKEKIDNRIRIDATEVTFENNSESYSDINALVLLVATNLAYHEPGPIMKRLVERELGFKQEDVTCFEIGDVQGYLAYDDHKLFIVFGGLLNVKNLKKTLKNTKYPVSVPTSTGTLNLKGLVHRGFASPVIGIWEKIDDVFRQIYKGQKVWVSGHSLGAAVGILMANLFNEKYNETMKLGGVYVYGCPKIGDNSWGNAYDRVLKPLTYRVVNATDLVPFLGSSAQQWRHVGTTFTKESNGLLANLKINTPQNSMSAHQIPSYFALLAPHHKMALERTLKDVQRDRIYSRNTRNLKGPLNLSESAWEDNSISSPRSFDQKIHVDLPTSNDISISRPSRRRQPQAMYRRSKSLSNLGVINDADEMDVDGYVQPYADVDMEILSPRRNKEQNQLGQDVEDQFASYIKEVQTSLSNLFDLVSDMTGEPIKDETDLSKYDHLRIRGSSAPSRYLTENLKKSSQGSILPIMTNPTRSNLPLIVTDASGRKLSGRSISLKNIQLENTEEVKSVASAMSKPADTTPRKAATGNARGHNPSRLAIRGPGVAPRTVVQANESESKILRKNESNIFGLNQQTVVKVLPEEQPSPLIHNTNTGNTPSAITRSTSSQAQLNRISIHRDFVPGLELLDPTLGGVPALPQVPQVPPITTQGLNQKNPVPITKALTARPAGPAGTARPTQLHNLPESSASKYTTNPLSRPAAPQTTTQPRYTQTNTAANTPNANQSIFLTDVAERERKARERLAQNQAKTQQPVTTVRNPVVPRSTQVAVPQQQAQQTTPTQLQTAQSARQPVPRQTLTQAQMAQQTMQAQPAQQPQAQPARPTVRAPENQPTPNPNLQNTTVSNRVPKEVRAIRTRSKSLSELAPAIPPVQTNNTASAVPKAGEEGMKVLKAPLHPNLEKVFSHMMSHLKIIQSSLLVLRNNLENTSSPDFDKNVKAVASSYKKPIENVTTIIQRILSFRILSANSTIFDPKFSLAMEKRFHNFTRECPKFKTAIEDLIENIEKGGRLVTNWKNDWACFSNAVEELIEITKAVL